MNPYKLKTICHLPNVFLMKSSFIYVLKATGHERTRMSNSFFKFGVFSWNKSDVS